MLFKTQKSASSAAAKKKMPLRILILIFFFLFNHTCRAQINQCFPSSCGKIQNISYPFRLNSDPKTCGDPRYMLSCENNLTIVYLYSKKYQVEAIHYNNQTIRIVDQGIQKGNCSSLPRYPLTNYNFSYGDPYELRRRDTETFQDIQLTKSVIFVSCEKPVKSHLYIDPASCSNGGSGSALSSALAQSKRHSYVIVNGSLSVSDMADTCGVELMVMVSNLVKNYSNSTSFMDIHNDLAYGFELSWLPGTTSLPT